MSIADGQLVLTSDASSAQISSASEASTSQQDPTAFQNSPGSSQHASSQGPSWQGLTGSNVDVSASVSRIGCRAYPPAMATLAPSIRFDLAQAVDAQRFGTDRAESGVQHQQLQRAALIEAALAQPARQPVPLEEQVTPSVCSCSAVPVLRSPDIDNKLETVPAILMTLHAILGVQPD